MKRSVFACAFVYPLFMLLAGQAETQIQCSEFSGENRFWEMPPAKCRSENGKRCWISRCLSNVKALEISMLPWAPKLSMVT